MPFVPPNPVVWTEIPVTDLNRAMDFYRAVFDYDLTLDDSGPNPMANIRTPEGGISGHLYPGTPAAAGSGPTVHLLVSDSLEATLARITAHGGTVLSPPIAIPPGRFAYATDPDGNSIGAFEAA